MCRPMGWLVVLILLEFTPDGLAQRELQRAQRSLLELQQKVRESAKTARRENRQPEFSWEDYSQRLLEVQNLINQGILFVLNRKPRPSGEELQNELRDVVGLGVAAELKASVFRFQTANRNLYVAGYGIGVGPADSRSWIGVFGSLDEGKPYKLLDSIDDSLPDKTIAIQPLSSHRGESGVTFLAHGMNWGDAHNRLTVIAYSFDGKTLKPIWSRADLPQGEVTVKDGSIVLNFLSSPLGPGHKSVHPVEEVYRVSPAGISLESRRPAEQKAPEG